MARKMKNPAALATRRASDHVSTGKRSKDSPSQSPRLAETGAKSGPKVLNVRDRPDGIPKDAVYIGRGSPWGNPFVIRKHGNRDQVCDRFETEILPTLDVASLRGRDLVCHCAPLRCHGDDILKKANAPEPAITGPRSLRDPRSREYAIQTMRSLKRFMDSKTFDAQHIAEELQLIEQHKHWEICGFKTIDAYLKAEAGVAYKELKRQNAMKPDPAVVRAFLADIHTAAARACEGMDHPGALQLVRVHPTGDDAIPTKFQIGDVDAMAAQAVADAEVGHNVFVELRTVRPDSRGRGEGTDTAAVFALAIDRDADKGEYGGEFLEPTMRTETSPGNAHDIFVFEKAVAYEAARKLGTTIRRKVGADDDSGVPTQPYRVAGTPNFPDANKLARGRTIYLTQYVNGGPIYDYETLLEAAGGELIDEAPAAAFDVEATGEIDRDVEQLVAEPLSKPNRSTRFAHAIKLAVERGMTATDFEMLCRANPQGCAQKYLPPERRDELQKRIAEIWMPHAEKMAKETAANAKLAEPLLANAARQKTAGTNSWRDHVFTAAELQRRTFPDVSYCVPGLIPEGLTIVAGKPKIGKSWLALDVCIAISGERCCLGERKPEPGDVLYAAMEDNPRRLQRRIDRLLSPISTQWPERLTLATAWRRLDKGGVDDIRQWIEQAGKPRLVILDTLAGVKPIRTREGYTEDYESLAALHRLANDTGVSIIVLHHTRKMEAEDPVDTVSGTLGLSGCADTVLVLARSSQGTTLYVRGRDIEEAEHAVSFDKDGCRWVILGSAAEVHRSNERGKILDVLRNATELLGPQEIADRARMKPDNVRYLLGQMVQDGEVMKASRGRYYHPDRSGLWDTPSQGSQPHN